MHASNPGAMAHGTASIIVASWEGLSYPALDVGDERGSLPITRQSQATKPVPLQYSDSARELRFRSLKRLGHIR
jgi:hypothetical protein